MRSRRLRKFIDTHTLEQVTGGVAFAQVLEGVAAGLNAVNQINRLNQYGQYPVTGLSTNPILTHAAIINNAQQTIAENQVAALRTDDPWELDDIAHENAYLQARVDQSTLALAANGVLPGDVAALNAASVYSPYGASVLPASSIGPVASLAYSPWGDDEIVIR